MLPAQNFVSSIQKGAHPVKILLFGEPVFDLREELGGGQGAGGEVELDFERAGASTRFEPVEERRAVFADTVFGVRAVELVERLLERLPPVFQPVGIDVQTELFHQQAPVRAVPGVDVLGEMLARVLFRIEDAFGVGFGY